MLRPANVVDLPVLRALIRDGAVAGSIDRELASESREAALFFANLRQALATGYSFRFTEIESALGDLCKKKADSSLKSSELSSGSLSR